MAGNSQILSKLIFEISSNSAQLKQGLAEANSSINQFKNQIKQVGTYIAAAFATEKILEAGKAALDFANEVGEAHAQVRDLTNTSGKDLSDLTANILSTSKAYGTDFTQTLETVNALVHTYGMDYNEAAQLVSEGIALQDEHAGELLGIYKSFSPTFKNLGLDAKQSFAIISQAMDSGVDANTLSMALSKANQNLRSLSDSARKAIDAIGLNSDAIAAGIQSGSISEYEAIQQITGAMGKFSNQSSEVGNLLKEIFGKSGQQINVDFIKSLSTLTTDFEQVKAQGDEVELNNMKIHDSLATIYQVADQAFGESATWFSSMKATLADLSAKVLVSVRDGIVNIINYGIDLYNNSLSFRLLIQGLILNFKELWEAIKLVFNLLIDTFANAGKLIKAVFTGNFQEIPKIWASALDDLKNNIVSFAKNSYDNFKDAAESAVNAKPLQLINLNDVKKQAKEAGKNFSQGFSDSVSNINAKQGKEKKDKSSLPMVQNTIGVDSSKMVAQINVQNKALGYQYSLIEKIGKGFRENIEGVGVTAMQSLGQSMAQSFSQGQQGFNGMLNTFVNGMKQMIAASLANALAEQIAANATLPFPLDLAAIAAGTAAIYAAFAAIPAFADGGYSDGGLSLVGEKGAELVSLPKGSYVHNNLDTNRILNGGGGSMAITIGGKLKGTDIYLQQQEVIRRRNNTI